MLGIGLVEITHFLGIWTSYSTYSTIFYLEDSSLLPVLY